MVFIHNTVNEVHGGSWTNLKLLPDYIFVTDGGNIFQLGSLTKQMFELSQIKK